MFFSIFRTDDLDPSNPIYKLCLYASYLYPKLSWNRSILTRYWAEAIFLYLVAVTLTLIPVTTWAIPNSIYRQDTYISSFGEIGHSFFLSGMFCCCCFLLFFVVFFFSILALLTLTMILVTPYTIPNYVFMQVTYILSFVEIEKCLLKLLSGYQVRQSKTCFFFFFFFFLETLLKIV